MCEWVGRWVSAFVCCMCGVCYIWSCMFGVGVNAFDVFLCVLSECVCVCCIYVCICSGCVFCDMFMWLCMQASFSSLL